MNQNSFSFIWMRTVPPFTSIQKVDLMLPLWFLALHVYSPESSNLAWRIMRVLFLPRSISPLVQSTSGVGKPLREQFNWRDELYVIDRFLSSGLIPGRPEDGINKHNSKKMKIREKSRKWRVTRREKVKACFVFSFTVLSDACILTSVFISHLLNSELVRGVR